MPVNTAVLRTAEIETTNAFLRGLMGTSTPVTDKLSTKITMKTKSVEAPIASMVGPMRKWTGERMVQKLKRGAYTITADDFEDTVGIPRNAFLDDTTGSYMASIQSLGVQVGLWPDQQICAKLERGETDTCYDGVAFFSASHPREQGSSSTFSNLTAGSAAPWYLIDASKGVMPLVWGLLQAPEVVNLWSPDDPNVFHENELLTGAFARGVADYGFPQLIHKAKVTLDATNFEAAVALMNALVNDAGENLQINPTHILIPSILKPAASRLFSTMALASGADNINYKAVEIVVGQRLSNT